MSGQKIMPFNLPDGRLSRRACCAAVLMGGLSMRAGNTLATSASAWRWKLTDIHRQANGQEQELFEGVLMHGWELEAQATSDQPGTPFDGTLMISLQAFSPRQPMSGQIPGRWYARGNWSLLDSAARPTPGARSAAGVLQGQLSAESPRSFVASSLDWHAQLRIASGRFASVQAPESVRPMRAEGALIWTADDFGTLELSPRNLTHNPLR
jgi:hypothetical protein